MSESAEVESRSHTLETILTGSRALLSIDVDYFLASTEREFASALIERVVALVQSGITMSCSDDHVMLTRLPLFPIDIVINFDYHMDCRQAYLLGEPPRIPADNATVFEALLSSRTIARYVWALPAARIPEVSRLYAKAVLAQRQPVLNAIHCVADWPTLARLLSLVMVEHIFVCRSPEYGSAETNAIYAELTSRRPTPAT